MRYVHLGRSGLKVSRLCLGCMTYGEPTPRWPWALDEQASRPFIRRALELGINFFDTANMYSAGKSEEVLGRALKDFARRDDVVIATKVFSPMDTGPNDMGLSRKHVMSQIDRGRRLRAAFSPAIARATAACRIRTSRSRGCCRNRWSRRRSSVRRR